MCCQISITLACSVSAEVDGWVHDALVFDPRRRRQLWRFGSYVLLHQGAAHAALNIVIQLLLATPLEREQKWTRTALVYFGGGLAGINKLPSQKSLSAKIWAFYGARVAGSLSTSVLAPDLYLVGASAGVYALLTSQLANIILVSITKTIIIYWNLK